jgi:branched-chain amino acid transport system substrate-binding protein
MSNTRAKGAIVASAILIGLGGLHPALAADKILKIGAPLPLTGALSPDGGRLKSGYDLWAEAQNAAGGIKAGADSYKVEIVYADYQSNTPRAVQSAERMISEDKVDAIFAPFGSGATKAVSAITEKYGVPMIASNAASVQVFDQGFKYLFGMYTPNSSVTQPLVDLVIEKNPSVKRVAVLARNDLFPLAIAEELTNYAKSKGLEIVSEQKFPIGSVDFSSALTQIRAANPDWIYATGYTNDMILIRKQMQEQGVKTQLVTMLIGPTTPEFIEGTGKLAENVVTSAWWDVAAKFKGEDVFGSAENFAQLYRKHYDNRYPDYSVASAAACGAVLQLAITKAGTVEKSKVRDQLAAMDTDTFFGHIKFGPTGQISSLKPPVMQIQNGAPVVVYPPEIKQSELRFDSK